MKLFTGKESKALKELLSKAVNKDEVLSLESLHGFLYCLAIIPETIVPSEWLPCIFGEEMIEVEDEEEGDRLFGVLFAAYNRFIDANDHDELTFPFDIGALKTNDLDRIRRWAYGFFLGTTLRPQVWGIPASDEFDDNGRLLKTPDEEDVDEDGKEIAACVMILMGVAFPEKIPELFVDADEKPLDDPIRVREQEVRSFMLLPQAIETLQSYARWVRDEKRARPRPDIPLQPRRAEKIGRNEPCPCGSGRKYKKCCGAS